MSNLTKDQLRDRTQSNFNDMTDDSFAAYLRMLHDSLKDLPTDTATVYAWKVFLSCVERFGSVTISCDMEDYGREPGDIVCVRINDLYLGFGSFPEAMIDVALDALKAHG